MLKILQNGVQIQHTAIDPVQMPRESFADTQTFGLEDDDVNFLYFAYFCRILNILITIENTPVVLSTLVFLERSVFKHAGVPEMTI